MYRNFKVCLPLASFVKVKRFRWIYIKLACYEYLFEFKVILMSCQRGICGNASLITFLYFSRITPLTASDTQLSANSECP